MNPYYHPHQSPTLFSFILILMGVVVIFSCTGQGVELIGSWVSTEITHPSPFFAETLGHEKHRNVTLIFDQAGEFVGLDHEGGCHMGTYFLQNDTLVLTESQDEPIPIGYALRGERLQLKSPDGFIFEFHRTSKDDPAGAKPCKR